MVSMRPFQHAQFRTNFQAFSPALSSLALLRGELDSSLDVAPLKKLSIKSIATLVKKFHKSSQSGKTLDRAVNIKNFLTSPTSKVDDLVPSLFIFDNLKLRIQGNSITKVGPTSLLRSKKNGHLRSVLTFSRSPRHRVVPLFVVKNFFDDQVPQKNEALFSTRPRSWSLESKTSNPSKLFEVVSYHGAKRLSLLDFSTSMRDFSRGVYWVIKSERLPYVASFKHYPAARYSSYKLNFNDLSLTAAQGFSQTQKTLYQGRQFTNIPDTEFLNQNYTDSSSRLLRVKQFLVLPISINMTAITTSTDIMHSWFIPNLGLKLDCVPGKMTHHTFMFNIPGVYYGQCAEICGRQHHHMPIKLVLVDWVHFMIYTNHFIYKQWEEVSKNINYGFEKKTLVKGVAIERLEFSYPSVYNRSFINKDILFDYEALCAYRHASKSY